MHIGCWWESQKEGKPRRRWADNIKMDHREVGQGSMYWIDLTQDRALVKVVMNNRVP
jgi:hypothetical protein